MMQYALLLGTYLLLMLTGSLTVAGQKFKCYVRTGPRLAARYYAHDQEGLSSWLIFNLYLLTETKKWNWGENWQGKEVIPRSSAYLTGYTHNVTLPQSIALY